jgi:hypothetical protein
LELEVYWMEKKKKPHRPSLRNVWEIDPVTRVHRPRTRYDRHREKEELRRGPWEEEEEEETIAQIR